MEEGRKEERKGERKEGNSDVNLFLQSTVSMT